MIRDPSADRAPSGVGRRDLLLTMGWTSLLAALAGGVGGLVRFLSPNVLFEPPAAFTIGHPEDYPVGTVTFLEERKVYLLRYVRGFRALSAVCTHLGCTVTKDVNQDIYRCPCHGSRFNERGEVEQGPANRSLTWHPVALAHSGRLRIDTGRSVRSDHYLELRTPA